jgi:hypothetical protein
VRRSSNYEVRKDLRSVTKIPQGRLPKARNAITCSTYRSGRSSDWLKMKNPNAPAVKREAEEDWGR